VALDSISNMLASGRLATADSLAAQLLSSARERRGARSLEMLAALDTVIRVFYAKSYYGPARRYSDRFVSLGEQLLGHDAVSLAPGFSRHSDLCGHVSDFAGARSYAERAVTLAETAPAHDRLELANYIDQLAATYSIENPDSTRALSERALEIRRAALGPDALEVAQSLRKLGIWLRVHGDYVSARERLEEALAIIDRKLARDDPGRCVFYNSYGALLGNSGDVAAAAEQFARCVSLSERAYGIYHYDVARFMNNLGLAYVDMRRFRNAEGCFDSALVIRERIQNLGGVAESQGSIGQLRVREGAYADAIPWLQKSLSYWTRSRPYGISVADMMDELATAYTHLGQYARAESCYALDFQVRDRLTPPGNP